MITGMRSFITSLNPSHWEGSSSSSGLRSASSTSKLHAGSIQTINMSKLNKQQLSFQSQPVISKKSLFNQMMSLLVSNINHKIFGQLEAGHLTLQPGPAEYRSQPTNINGVASFIERHPQSKKLLNESKHKMLVERYREEHKECEKKRQQQILKQQQAQQLQRIQEEERLVEVDLMYREEKRRRALLNIEAIKGREERRRLQEQQNNDRLKAVKKEALLFERLEKNYQSNIVLPMLEQQKQRLEQTKERKKGVDHQALREHQRFFLKMRREVSEMHKLQLKQRLDREVYKPDSKLKVARLVREEQERLRLQRQQKLKQPVLKAKKINQYSEFVRQNFVPVVKQSESQSQQTQSRATRLSEVSPTEVGLRYLKELKQLNTKIERRESSNLQTRSNSNMRAKSEMKNYLEKRPQEELDRLKQKKIESIIKNCETRKESVGELMNEIERIDQRLKKGEQLKRVLSKESPDAEEYIQSINFKIKALEAL